MTQDNIYAYAQFSVIGGNDFGAGTGSWEDVRTTQIFASHEAAIDYARDLIDDDYYYAYVIGIGADGVPDLVNVIRVADTEPSQVSLA
jgi:hypothetical protein